MAAAHRFTLPVHLDCFATSASALQRSYEGMPGQPDDVVQRRAWCRTAVVELRVVTQLPPSAYHALTTVAHWRGWHGTCLNSLRQAAVARRDPTRSQKNRPSGVLFGSMRGVSPHNSAGVTWR